MYSRMEASQPSKREVLKKSIYATKERLGWVTTNFIPLVMKHFGQWGSDTQQLLNHLVTINKLVNMTDNNMDTFKSTTDTTDMVFTLKQLQEKSKEQLKPFDLVNRKAL